MKRILVTGNQGYIGVELVKKLKEVQLHVTGVDVGLFSFCHWYSPVKADCQIARDFRTLTVEELSSFDAIIHLAALSNDPMGNLQKELTLDVNYRGASELAKKAKAAGVRRFIFLGSCSVYGQGVTAFVDEQAPLFPLSTYALSKIEAEKEILQLQSPSFTPVSLRAATAYGSSAMLRLDLVVNQLLAMAYTEGKISLMSDGSSWRPFIHCRDIAAACIECLFADEGVISGEAFNTGCNKENYQIFTVAQMIQKLLPQSQVTFSEGVQKDPRSYSVSFTKFQKAFPHFTFSYSLQKGMEELFKDFQIYGMSLADLTSPRYIRLKKLQETINLLGEKEALVL